MPFNPLIAIDLSWADAFADFRAETFTRCWNAQVGCALNELVIDGARLHPAQLAALARELAASPSFLEDILGCYFDELVAGGELPARGADATAWAVGVADHLVANDRLWKTRVEIYKHTWKIRRLYSDTSAVSLTPLYQILDPTTPNISCASEIYLHLQAIDDFDDVNIPEWLINIGVAPSVANVRFLNFLLYNDLRFVSSVDIPFRYLRINSLFDNFEGASAHHDFDGCVEASGFSLRDGIDPSRVKLAILSHAVIERFQPPDACAVTDRDELTLKAFLRSKEQGELAQGVPLATHHLIMETIRKLGRIVSLRDIRRLTGASRLRFDPFQLDPGPIVVYAPGDRYLVGDAVSFCLRDWVQDEAHKKGRVAADRILTPLKPCTIATSPEIRDACMTSSRAFREARVVFRDEACGKLKPDTDRQGQRWATERTLRAVDACLTANGLVRAGDAYFEKTAWDLRDSKRLSPQAIRARIVTSLSSGHAPPAVNRNADLRDRIAQACRL